MLKILQIPRFPSEEIDLFTLTYETASSPFRGEVSSREAKAIKFTLFCAKREKAMQGDVHRFM